LQNQVAIPAGIAVFRFVLYKEGPLTTEWIYSYTSSDPDFSEEQMDRLIELVKEWEREDFEFLQKHPILNGFHYKCPQGAVSFKNVYLAIEAVEKWLKL